MPHSSRRRAAVCLWISLGGTASAIAMGGESATSLFKSLSEAGVPTVSCVESPGTLYAAMKRPGLTKALLEAGVTEDWEDLPLDPRIGRLLAKAAEDPDIRLEHGETPLIQAVQRGWPEAIEILLDKGADVNLRDRAGHSALHYAIEAGSLDTVTLLLAAGAEPQTEPKRDGGRLKRLLLLNTDTRPYSEERFAVPPPPSRQIPPSGSRSSHMDASRP